ncbi:MAG: DsbA family oxidoreductase [Myxococcales bacterium]|nr:DsbA family oxidoreductase [Myxococcales bacterium]
MVEIEKLRKEYDLAVDWRPFFLRPETPPEGSPVPAYVRERMKDPDDPLKKRAEREGLKMVRRETIPSTRRAHEAAEYARSKGKLEPMHGELLKAYWTEGKDLHSFDVLREAAVKAGLDPDEMQRELEKGTFKPIVEEGIREAHELGIHAVPTFVFDDRLAVQGAQELPVFRLAMQQLGARKLT